MKEGIIKVYLNNRKVKEYLATKEKFVALNSFIKNPTPGKSKVKLCNDVILISDIVYIEWEEAND